VVFDLTVHNHGIKVNPKHNLRGQFLGFYIVPIDTLRFAPKAEARALFDPEKLVIVLFIKAENITASIFLVPGD
jgi:hypothetical protein